LAKNKMW